MSNREYPERPLVGVGGVVIENDSVLLVRRGTEPLRGQWSIPGGLLEAGETLIQGVVRELYEETGLTVRVLELIEALERIFPEPSSALDSATSHVSNRDSDSSLNPARTADLPAGTPAPGKIRPRYHYVILDYLCERVSGEPHAGTDVTEVAFASQSELPRYSLSPGTLRVIDKAFAMSRGRSAHEERP